MHLTWLRSVKHYISYSSMNVRYVLERMLYNPVNYMLCRLCWISKRFAGHATRCECM